MVREKGRRVIKEGGSHRKVTFYLFWNVFFAPEKNADRITIIAEAQRAASQLF